jgi:hypothetical protein
MKRWDKVEFFFGNKYYKGTVLEVEKNRVRVRFFPWVVSGHWVNETPWRKMVVLKRSWIGKLLDWNINVIR